MQQWHMHALQLPPGFGAAGRIAEMVCVLLLCQVLALSRRGLEARGMGEEAFLAPLEKIAATGVTCADKLRQHFAGDWGSSIDPLFSSQEYYF
jgi:glutamate--cysteine ligase